MSALNVLFSVYSSIEDEAVLCGKMFTYALLLQNSMNNSSWSADMKRTLFVPWTSIFNQYEFCIQSTYVFEVELLDKSSISLVR